MTIHGTVMGDTVARRTKAEVLVTLRLCRQKLKAAKGINSAKEMQQELLKVQCLLHHEIAPLADSYWLTPKASDC